MTTVVCEINREEEMGGAAGRDERDTDCEVRLFGQR